MTPLTAAAKAAYTAYQLRVYSGRVRMEYEWLSLTEQAGWRAVADALARRLNGVALAHWPEEASPPPPPPPPMYTYPAGQSVYAPPKVYKWAGVVPEPAKWTASDGTIVYRSYQDYVMDCDVQDHDAGL